MNGGKDIKFGDDKRPVSIIPKEQQVLHDFATGEVLVDEFGVPLLAEKDAIFTPDATADRSTSIVFGDTNNVYRRKVFETISPSVPAIYGDYDASIAKSITFSNVNNPDVTTGIATVKTLDNVGFATVGIGSIKILLRDEIAGVGKTITHDQWPNMDVRVVEEKLTDESGNLIPVSAKKLYFPDSVGISTILKVDISDADPQTDKKFLVSGKFLDGNVKIENVAYNSRIIISEPHTAGDKILGESSSISCSVSGSIVTVTLSNHGFITDDFLYIKTQLSSPSSFVDNATYNTPYKITSTGDNTFQYDLGQNKNNFTGRVYIKVSKNTKTFAESFNLERTEDFGSNPVNRYGTSVKHQRHITSGFTPSYPSILGDPFNKPDESFLNRGGWQLRRHQEKVNPWKNQDPRITKKSKVPQHKTGRNVDLIVVDDGCWFGHIEFQNFPPNIKLYDGVTTTKTGKPNNYIGGNALRKLDNPSDGFSGDSPIATSAEDGLCDLLDLVLDGPYYIDPAWFEASATTRLTTRWDGTKVPNEAVARAWWSDSSQRSSAFSSVDTVTIPAQYTRDNNNGKHTAYPKSTTDHGTQSASKAYGKQYGWAYNANKWFLAGSPATISQSGSDVLTTVSYEDGFKIQKIFHENKPIHSAKGNKNPTVSSNSWALDFTTLKFGTSGYYYFRQGTSGSGGVQFTSWDMKGDTDGTGGTAPRFMTNFSETTIRAEPISGSPLTAGDALVNSGVIFVCSAGNNRQKIVEGGHPDYNNYVGANNAALSASTFTDGGMTFLKTINRPGFPAAIGKSTDGSGNTVYNTIIVGSLNGAHHNSNGKEVKASDSNMGNAVDCYAAGQDTLAAKGDGQAAFGGNTGYNRYDAFYTHDGDQSLESFDLIYDGTSSACPTAAGLIATKLQFYRNWTYTNVKNWLSNDVGEQKEEDFHRGTEVTTANSVNWNGNNNDADKGANLHGGSPTIIWDSLANTSTFPAFKLNQENYSITNAFKKGLTGGPSGDFSDIVNGNRKKQLSINGGTSSGISSVQLQNTSDFFSNFSEPITSGKYSYGKQLGLEFVNETDYDDLTLKTDSGYFYIDNNRQFYTLDNRINSVSISKSELQKIKSDVVLKVAEEFPESSEVSTTLLGVNRAETQLSLFSNVSSYGLESKDWEVVQFRGTVSLRDWEERINAVYGQRTRGEVLEETQESAIKLNTFPVPNTFPFGPKFEKNNLYNDESKQGFFGDYVKFIQMGLDLYNNYNKPGFTNSWKNKFLNPELVSIDRSDETNPDVIYNAGSEISFAAIDNWTESYRDIRSNGLVAPDGTVITFLNVNQIIGGGADYNSTNTRPGYYDTPRRYLLLQSRRVFRYQPGRISGFTFGVRAAREFNTGFKLEWGIFNKTDHYVFQIDQGLVKIVRRSKIPLPDYILNPPASVQTIEKSPDPQDSFESEYNPNGLDYNFYETVISQDAFNGDSLDGNGPSGHSVKPENITMWKIEFGWYGAIGARFYAYIPAGNGEARWVTLHTLVIENKMGQPCLVDPYFRFRYVTNITKTTDIRTPQFVYKYGASYYIDGGDEGTTTQFSIKTKPDFGKVGVSVGGTTALLGIRPKDQIFNSQGVGTRTIGGDIIKIFNKKIIIPTQLNITTTQLTKIRVGVCTACPGWGYVHTIGLRRNGTDNSLPSGVGLGRQMPIKMLSEGGKIEPFIADTANPIYFRKEDIGAKIIAPSIYNCYIEDVQDDSGNSALLGQDSATGSGDDNFYTDTGYPSWNAYTTAIIKGFGGLDTFNLSADRVFYGEGSTDRSVSPSKPIILPNDVDGDGVYRSEASKLLGSDATATAQPIRLSNYDGLAISEYQLTGSEIDIQFVIPRSARDGGIDPTWGYSHWADVMVGVTDVKPYQNDELGEIKDSSDNIIYTPEAAFSLSYDNINTVNGEKIIENPSPGVANTTFLPNDKILFAQHTHAWARSDINGNDSTEAWPIFQYRSRLGLIHSIPSLTGISTGRCGRVKIRVGDPELIGEVEYTTTPPVDGAEGQYFFTSNQNILSTLTPVEGTGYDGGQVAYVKKLDDDTFETQVTVDDNSVFVGALKEYDTGDDEGTKKEYIRLSNQLDTLSDGDVVKVAIRRVTISTEFSEQNNNKTKLFKYAVFPLYPVIKLKDYGEINNISIKEKIGETITTVAPKFLTNNCTINNYGGLADNESTPPTNFLSVGDLSGAEFDNQNKCKIRDFVQKDVFFVGENQTTSVDMSKVFSQDKEVINADESNSEATFIIANEINPDPGVNEAVIQASLNFKEQ